MLPGFHCGGHSTPQADAHTSWPGDWVTRLAAWDWSPSGDPGCEGSPDDPDTTASPVALLRVARPSRAVRAEGVGDRTATAIDRSPRKHARRSGESVPAGVSHLSSACTTGDGQTTRGSPAPRSAGPLAPMLGGEGMGGLLALEDDVQVHCFVVSGRGLRVGAQRRPPSAVLRRPCCAPVPQARVEGGVACDDRSGTDDHRATIAPVWES